MTRLVIPKDASENRSSLFAIVHSDVCVPMEIESKG